MAADKGVLSDVDQRRNRTRGERYENAALMSAAAVTAARQPCQYGYSGILASRHVRERDANLHRRAIGLTCDGHPPAFRLHDEVVAQPAARLAESGDRTPDQIGLRLQECERHDAPSLLALIH